ncbi:ABC transporter ATP-binding protein [Aureisphaera galaxeae]|uniref:ABC transporter ATP-binding protein n=1 Tax=Aureisphaera galaxeae TaxID=1538023 RepID=UPI002350F761|nr:ABC transporter ATP-binding protein [Aureisphaera galaxeae]MDC8005864.1 ABC transporter ATP-binding protein [Aureisphaera galaxeae]
MLKAINLTKTYGKHQALSQLNLSVDKGEIFCLLGQNGAGKTTTINLFLGLIGATEGEALIDGIAVQPNNNKTSQKIAYIPEVVQLYSNLSGIENLNFFSRLAGFKYSNTELSDLLLKVGLQETAHHNKMSSYSKGMRQKVGIAIALSKNADYIFMDEPISGLDPKAALEFTKICKGLSDEGKAIFMATHDIFNAVNVGTKIGIMKEGKLVHTSTTDQISATELQNLYLKTI